MKHLLLTIIAAVVLVGCGDAEEPTTHPEQPKLSDMRKSSMSPLNIAAEKGDLKAVKELLDSGVDIDSLDHTGTPFYSAAQGKKEVVKEVVELLIANGADVNAKNKVGRTPLNFAIKKPEIAGLLRKHGGKTGEELKAEGQ